MRDLPLALTNGVGFSTPYLFRQSVSECGTSSLSCTAEGRRYNEALVNTARRAKSAHFYIILPGYSRRALTDKLYHIRERSLQTKFASATLLLLTNGQSPLFIATHLGRLCRAIPLFSVLVEVQRHIPEGVNRRRYVPAAQAPAQCNQHM